MEQNIRIQQNKDVLLSYCRNDFSCMTKQAHKQQDDQTEDHIAKANGRVMDDISALPLSGLIFASSERFSM